MAFLYEHEVKNKQELPGWRLQRRLELRANAKANQENMKTFVITNTENTTNQLQNNKQCFPFYFGNSQQLFVRNENGRCFIVAVL